MTQSIGSVNQILPGPAQVLFFNYQNARISYHKYGSGPVCLIGFHGYGQDSSAFEEFARTLGSEYTIYSLDLFFHGQSHWPNRQLPLDKIWLKAMFVEWLAVHQIYNFVVCGFSMGARFAVCMFEFFPDKTTQVWLIAPDGLKINFWYYAATKLKLSRSIFKYLIFKPNLFFSIIGILHTCRLLQSSALRFASSQMNTRRKRWRVFSAWTIFRNIFVQNQVLIQLFNTNPIPLHIFVGKYDRILPAKNSHYIAGKVKNCELKILESGHSNLLEKVIRHIEQTGFGRLN